MKYLSVIAAFIFIGAGLNAATPSRKLELDLKSELGCMKGQYQLTYNQKYWSLTEHNLTLVLKIISEVDNRIQTKIKIFKNPEKSTDQALLIAQPIIIVAFGQKATITIDESNKDGMISHWSLGFTISQE